MPYIFKPKSNKSNNKNEKNQLIYKTVYNTRQWRNLRMSYLSTHPLCENCLQQDPPRITPATQVHHKYEISNAETTEEMKVIGFDYDNLEALCDACHNAIHNHKRKTS